MRLMKLICVFCLVAINLGNVAFAYDDTPIIVLREDDCRSTCRDTFAEFGNKSFLQYAKDLRMPITWAVITNYASNSHGWDGLTWAELIDYVSIAGGELASHSASHVPMSSIDAYIDDLLKSKAAIQANTPYTCNTFLQPGTWTGDAYFNSYAKLDNKLGQAITNNFAQSQLYITWFTWSGSAVYMHGEEISCGIDYQNRPVTSELLQTIDYIAQNPGSIYVIAFHGIQPSTTTLDYHTRADLMAALLTKLADMRRDGLIRIASLNDAYSSSSFSPNLNRINDPGFELNKIGLLKYFKGVWRPISGTTFVDEVGYNASQCARLVPGGCLQQLIAAPSGRYKLSWIQKPDNGTPLYQGTRPQIIAIDTKNNSYNVVDAPTTQNTTPDWEQKSIILRVPNQDNRLDIRFYTSGGFLIDNVSLRLTDTDPNECVSNFKVTPTPSGFQLSWRAPDNSLYNKIQLRYRTSKNSPQTINDGMLIQEIVADNGHQQSFFYPYNWNGASDIYFSAFAVKEDNTYSEPSVDYLKADLKKPFVSNLTIKAENMDAVATWQVSLYSSDIYTTRYSIGTMPLSSDVIDWTPIDTSSVLIQHPDPNYGYLNVQTESVFGVWSDIVSAPVPMGQPAIVANNPVVYPNDTLVNTTGEVSAIFSDCYYIQNSQTMRGIKVVGPIALLSLGTTVTVEGLMKTEAGERYIKILQ